MHLPEASAVVLRGNLDLVDLLTMLIEEVEQWMTENLEVDEFVRLLTTLPALQRGLQSHPPLGVHRSGRTACSCPNT